MEEIFYELIEEAANGKVIIDNEIWPIGFNTIIYNNTNIKLSLINESNLITLIIQDENLFFKKLNEYIDLEKEKNRKCIKFTTNQERNTLKTIIAYLFVNATSEDFLNPINLIERNIEFLKDNTFNYLNNSLKINLNETFFNTNLEIKNTSQSILMETPKKLEFRFTSEANKEEFFQLPTISYGISKNLDDEKVCYIYSILNEDKERQINNPLSKKINRLLYKLNKGISEFESLEYHAYKNQKSSYYPENISDVSVSMVMSLIIFISILKKEKIKYIKGVTYLPIRYLSRFLVANKQSDVIKKDILNERNDLIQTNITDKFIRTFRRVSHYIKDLEIISYPYEASEFLEIELGFSKINYNNPIIEEIKNSLNK